MRRHTIRCFEVPMMALVLAAAVAAPRSWAQEPAMDPGPAADPQGAVPGDVDWTILEHMAVVSKQRAAVLVPLGAILAGVGLALVGSEFTRGDTRSGSDSTLLASCTLQLRLGTFLTLEGAHVMAAGFAYLGRGVHLRQLAHVRRVEGPSSMWGGWYSEGQGLRLGGNVLMHLGAIALSGGVSYLAPYPTCEQLYCGQCGVSDHTLSTQRAAGISLAVIGGAALLSGAILAAVGYSRQFALVRDRHAYRQASVQLLVGPGGPLLIW